MEEAIKVEYFRIATAIICLLGFAFITQSIRKRDLELRYCLSWFGSFLFVLLMAASPTIHEAIAKALGFTLASNFFILSLLAALTLITLSLTVALSRAKQDIRRLAQKQALDTATNLKRP